MADLLAHEHDLVGDHALSEEASRQRKVERRWAAPGGSHDRLIGALKSLLPIAVGILTAFLAVAPFTHGGEVSFVLDKNKVDMATERLKVTEALYRGEDGEGRPFSLRAGSAVQKSSRDPVVQLNDLEARIKMDGSAAVVAARRGQYDMHSENVSIDGPVQFDSESGYRLTTRDIDVNLNSRKVSSRGQVDGRMPIGTFSADKLTADLDTRTVALTGRARLRINQNGLKGQK